jgi:hypothetical protein
VSPRPDWQLRPHGTAAAARRHYRRGTPVCDPCRQYESRRVRDVPRRPHVTHADRGDGYPRCGVWNIDSPLIAAPGETVTCKRCDNARGGTW